MGRVIRILCLVLAFLHFMVSSWSFSSSFLPSSHLCLPDQRVALLEFKSTISLDDDCEMYPKTNSWNKSIDCCSWEGVSCNRETGHVIGIDLSNSCLNGSLVANSSLFHLHSLQRLDLSFNWLDGSPLENSSLFRLQGLQRLNLAYNHFNGSISSELFSQSVSLTHLNLSNNDFSELIPHEISLLSNLVSLDLSDFFTLSSLRLDAQGFDMLARNLTKLRNLFLDNVDMSGVAVTSFLNLTSSLEHLSFGECQLRGNFPSEVFLLPYLQHIDLHGNEYLTGYLPKTNFSTALTLLNVGNCGFKGPIPALLGNLPQIVFIDLSKNSFEGKIPKTLFNLTQIIQLDFSHNHLEGSLPNHVSELQLLEVFSLSNNSVGGGVPSWLFTLPSLQELDLSYNNLTGPIDQIQKPSFVYHVDLSHNKIQGPIPNSFFDLVNISSLELSSNNLSGVIKPVMLSKLRNLSELHLSNNKFLSLSTNGSGGNYSFPNLDIVEFSSCSIRQFPYFFRTVGLSRLDLSNNNISGGISKWEAEGWEYLTMLNLSYNCLTTLEGFPGKNLIVLDLRSNSLQGPILLNLQIPNPPQSMMSFIISENKLTGSIPSWICSWSSLTVLDLSKNNLSGTIPDCLVNFSDLTFLNLEMNNLSGKIPDSFRPDQLSDVLLNDNQLEGLVPRSLASCSSLEVLNLGNNKLIDTFPHWLASLPSLEVLILRSNRLHGSLPNSIAPSEFSALRIIDLSGNEFTGPLPTKFFRNLRAMKSAPGEMLPESNYREGYERYQISLKVRTKRSEIELVKTLAIFRAMDFSNNLFSGGIPEELGELISLQMLNFSHNKFSGPIPASFGNLVALESLDLSSNNLCGRIPSQLTNVTFLEVLNLSENNLVGPIPHGNQFDTFDNDSYRGNLGLCGFPLSKQCGNPPPPKFKEDEDSGIAFIWKLAMMGYGCGLVLGLSTGYIMFTTGRPWWFVRMVERDLQRKTTRWIRRIQGRRNKHCIRNA
ncbi:hypothetical protein PTKIN_Ptkin14bG0168500 [Pterospermum kingtungense]